MLGRRLQKKLDLWCPYPNACRSWDPHRDSSVHPRYQERPSRIPSQRNWKPFLVQTQMLFKNHSSWVFCVAISGCRLTPHRTCISLWRLFPSRCPYTHSNRLILNRFNIRPLFYLILSVEVALGSSCKTWSGIDPHLHEVLIPSKTPIRGFYFQKGCLFQLL